MAIFPHNIPGFVDVRNILDDVDANTINTIQRELTAVAGVIGPMPHVYNDIAIPSVIVTPVPGDTGDLTEYTPATGAYNPSVTAVNHATISNRLDNIERGQQSSCFQMGANNINFPKSASVGLGSRPRGIRFPHPGSGWDPFGMYNGMGANIRKAGFWSIEGNVVVNLGGNDAQRVGAYVAALDIEGNYTVVQDRQFYVTGTSAGTLALNVTYHGFLARGWRVTLRVAHDSNIAHSIVSARMAGFLVREG